MMVMMMMSVKIVVMVVVMVVVMMMSVTHGGFSSPPPFLVCPLDTPHLSLLYIPWKYHTICCKANKEENVFSVMDLLPRTPTPPPFPNRFNFRSNWSNLCIG